MKLKMDGDGKPVLDGELPVFVDEKGQELPINVGDLVAKVNKLSSDLDSTRKRAAKAEEKLTSYNGMDVEAARKALETVQNLDEKKLIDAGKVEDIKRGMKEAFDLEKATWQKTVTEKDGVIRTLSISSKIAASDWLKKNLLIPPDMFEATFGQKHFQLEDGKVKVLDQQGNVIMSRKSPGEYADVDEGIEAIVAAYPARDSILRTTGAKGSGAQGGDAGGHSGTVSKKSDLKTPAEKSAWIAEQREAGKDGFAAYQELPA